MMYGTRKELNKSAALPGIPKRAFHFARSGRCMPDYGPTSRQSSCPPTCWPARLTDVAGLALDAEDAQTWLLISRHYPSMADVQADITWLRQLLAA